MNNQRIIDWVDGLFAEFEQTDKVKEQKEELQLHITERTKEYMAGAMDFDMAFAAAKDDLGNLDELLASFERKEKRHAQNNWEFDSWEEKPRRERKFRFRFNFEGIVALSPFIYLFLGFMFGCWAWGWMVVPVSAILLTGGGYFGKRLIGISPFVYLFLGAFFGLWAWGWIIIPVSAILFGHGPMIKRIRD